MRTRFIAKHICLAAVLVALLVNTTGCTNGLVSPINRLATIRPLYTPSGGNGQNNLVVPPPTPTDPPVLLPTAVIPVSSASPTPQKVTTPEPPILYYSQAGDTLTSLALRFGVAKETITSPQPISADTFIDPGQLLLIPHVLGEVSSTDKTMPDSEIVFSPSALDFDINQFVKKAGGYLSSNVQEWHTNGWNDGAQLVYHVAIDNSINPRLLLAIIEYQSHWVYSQPANLAQTDFPVGYVNYQKKGLYLQLSWAVEQLYYGYYGWRSGQVTEITFTDGKKLRLAPDLNAGTVSLLYLFAQMYDEPNWAGAMYGQNSLPALYEKMFGSPWVRAQTVEPLFPATLTQPALELPFRSGYPWSFTGGPHSAWGPGARAAVDFAPSTTEHGCYTSEEWVTAMASGLVVRSEPGVVVVDLDGDGHEQTGWDILYLHISSADRIPVNTWVNTNDRIGHPSCEGGLATGTHVHLARKYNGEWILADGPIPFVLSGWQIHAGAENYQGYMTKGSEKVTASIYGDFYSRITR